jgi:hypothetical protein
VACQEQKHTNAKVFRKEEKALHRAEQKPPRITKKHDQRPAIKKFPIQVRFKVVGEKKRGLQE